MSDCGDLEQDAAREREQREFSDDFDRGGEALGPGWQVLPHRGFGIGLATRLPVYPPDFTEVSARVGSLEGGAEMPFYGRRASLGAVLRADSACAGCGVRIVAGDVVTADLAPGMAGVFRHTDCADPKLERVVDDV